MLLFTRLQPTHDKSAANPDSLCFRRYPEQHPLHFLRTIQSEGEKSNNFLIDLRNEHFGCDFL